MDQRRFDNQHHDDAGASEGARAAYVGSREAAKLLGIDVRSLYAYVSRGLVRSVPGGPRRSRLYARADLERLRARASARAGHTAVAAGALRFGEPVLDTSITEIDATKGPLYRGIAAVDLVAKGTPFEDVVAHLWQASTSLTSTEPARTSGESPTLPSRLLESLLNAQRKRAVALPLDAAPLVLAARRLADPAPFARNAALEHTRAMHVVRLLAASLGLGLGHRERFEQALGAQRYARLVGRALGLSPSRTRDSALDAALVVSADHELNVSSFAARVAASSGADLYACLAAALATFSGPLHGTACDRIETTYAAWLSLPPQALRRELEAGLRRGEAFVGFGHPLYPDGDPRPRPLLALARELAPRDRRVRSWLELVRAVRELAHEAPTIDLGLVVLAHALDLPYGAASSLFFAGRMAGWVAHALEQREQGHLLRPRARYVPS